MLSSQRDETKYLVRGFQSKLRCGIQNQSVLQAVGHAMVMSMYDEAIEPDGSTAADAGRNNDDVLDVFKAENDGELEKLLDRMEHAIKRAFSEVPNFEILATQMKKLKTGELGGKDKEKKELTVTQIPDKLLATMKTRPGIPLKPML